MSAKMPLLWLLALLLLAPPADCDLESLLNFVNGGSNPVVQGSNLGQGPPRAGPRVRQRPTASIAAPIPFAELADPSRGVVPLDVPQPKHAKVASNAGDELRRVEAETLRRRNRINGLPAGATQVGGKTVDLKPVVKKRPAPLSEVQVPIFLSQRFPNPLNDIDPYLAPLQEPVESTLQPMAAGRAPRPNQIPTYRFAEVMVLSHLGNQQQQQQSRGQQQHRQQQQQHRFDRLSQAVFQNGNQQDVHQNAAHEEAIRQVKLQEQKLLQQHQQHLQQRNQLQQRPRPHQQAQQHQQPSLNQEVPRHSHFSIPGQHRHRQFADELKLAEEALKQLG